MTTIKYVGYYSIPGDEPQRLHNLAAVNKMNYICDAINRAGFDVHIISPSWITEKHVKLVYWQQTRHFGNRNLLSTTPSLANRAGAVRLVNSIISLAWLFLFLIKNTHEDEKVLVYHSPWLSLPVRLAKRIKRFELILEIEEVYSQIWTLNHFLSSQEQKILNLPQKTIVASEILARTLDKKNCLILYGSYKPKASIGVKRKDTLNQINVVYTGSIDYTKGGAFNLIDSCRYLSENYQVHILGFGGKNAIREMEKKIDCINSELGRTTCTYYGTLINEAFDEFLQSCDIGVNPQRIGRYMDTAFPSKILTYLSYNLRVVSTPIASVVESSISNLVTFSENDAPRAISAAIRSIDLSQEANGEAQLRCLDDEFVRAVDKFLRL